MTYESKSFLLLMGKRRKIFPLVMANLLGTLLLRHVHATATEEDKGTRVHGGEDSKPHEFPSYVTLRYGRGGRFCGGSIINQDWIVTAAHCVDQYYPSDIEKLSVIAGETSSYDKVKQQVNFSRIIFHHKFNKSNRTIWSGYDIALIRVHPSIRFSYNASPANLPSCKTYTPGKAWAVGFGQSNTTFPGQPTKVLQKKEVPMIPNSECLNNRTSPPTPAKDVILCTRKDGSGGVCYGDSGSPLYVWTKNVTWTQVGIVSGGTSCFNGHALFTKISHFVGWIHRRISGCGNYPTSPLDIP